MVLVLPGCGDTHDKAMTDMVSGMNRLAESLGSVKDKATAEAAKGKLKEIREELKAVKARMKELGDPKEEAAAKLKEKYGKDLEAAMQKMQTALAGLITAGPEAQAVLRDVMGGTGDLSGLVE